MSARWLLAAAPLLLALCGCSQKALTYLERRGMDLADCFDVSAGVGEVVPYVRLKASDYFVVGAGHGGTLFAVGWHGRYTAAGTPCEGGRGVPFVRNQEWRGAPPMVETRWFWRTERRYDPDLAPSPGTALAERFWVGGWVSWFLSLRANINPVEFADFIVGWFDWDLLKDDATTPVDWSERARGRGRPYPVL